MINGYVNLPKAVADEISRSDFVYAAELTLHPLSEHSSKLLTNMRESNPNKIVAFDFSVNFIDFAKIHFKGYLTSVNISSPEVNLSGYSIYFTSVDFSFSLAIAETDSGQWSVVTKFD